MLCMVHVRNFFVFCILIKWETKFTYAKDTLFVVWRQVFFHLYTFKNDLAFPQSTANFNPVMCHILTPISWSLCSIQNSAKNGVDLNVELSRFWGDRKSVV